MIVVLLGAPGVGKGTQAVGLAAAMNVPHVSTGDLFRAHLRDRSPLGVEAEAYMNRGDLVPDDIVIGMVRDRLSEPDAAEGAVLDGFPRTVAQAEALDEMLGAVGRERPDAIALDVPVDDLVRRLTGRRVCRAAGHPYHVDFKQPKIQGRCDIDGSELYQRADDSLETVMNRMQVYERETAPLLAYYGEDGRLTSIDGAAPPDVVGERLRQHFGLGSTR